VTNLRRLECFLAVARERNFTRAAERLHLAQPALSRQVRGLERELGTELIHRTTHDFELTDAGALLLARGPELLASADALWRSVRAHGTGESGDVVVAYGASASYDTAPRLLEALARDQPGIAIETQVRAAREIVAGVQDGSLDLGLVRCPPDAPDLERRTVRADRQGLLMRSDHRLADAPEVRLTDLSEEPLLLHPREANPGHYDAVLALCREQDVVPDVVLRSLVFDLTQAPVVHGDAVAIVGESSCSALPAGLAWRPLTPARSLGIDLVARRHDRSPAVGRLLDAADRIAGELGWV
jgi:DNA-binding transcriptional LysR family regulator